MNYRTLWICSIMLGSVMSCKKPAPIVPGVKQYQSDFSKDADGWEGDFAEWLPPYSQQQWNFIFERAPLPHPLDENVFALKIAGTNRSDDLFMFVKRKLTGLAPNTFYKLIFNIEMASNAPTDGIGAGGRPSALTIKAGAIAEEPQIVYNTEQGLYMLENVDKGDQAAGGKDVKLLGDVGVKPGQSEYMIIYRDNKSNPHETKTNEKGELWVFVGTDSGFEARSELYYKSISISFNR